ncbi:MAG: type II toxin-antitoxin system HicB family antitoxin [Acidobacteriia bacterium]|nr:type II toxin-antitoxin system HicB family antitoxin [Terriglobia bacterium]
MEYPAKFEPAKEGGFVIEFPDFGWGVSQGEDEEDGRRMAADLLTTMVLEHIRMGKDLPQPSKPRGRKYRLIRLPALQAMKAELYLAFRASGMKKAELARRLGIPQTVVDRLFDFSNHTRLEQLEAAFAVLGKQLTIEVQDAA